MIVCAGVHRHFRQLPWEFETAGALFYTAGFDAGKGFSRYPGLHLALMNPGYNRKLGERARVLSPGQMTIGPVRSFDNFRKLFSLIFKDSKNE